MKLKILHIFIIVFFLLIGISYNNSQAYPIVLFISETIKKNVENDFAFSISFEGLNFNLLLLELLIVLIFMLWSLVVKNNILKLISVVCMFCLWLKNFVFLDWIINSSIYFWSSLPYLILTIIYIFILVKRIKKT